MLQRLNGFGMDHLCSVVGHFHHLPVIQLLQAHGVRKEFGVCVHHAFRVFPDSGLCCIRQVGKKSGGIIAAFAAQGSALVLVSGSDESLCDKHIMPVEGG